MTLGAGRVIYQSFTRINKAIADGDFFTNPTFCKAIDAAREAGGAVHILGLLSTGGVHSHEQHLVAAIQLAAQRGCEKIYLHGFLDGRDTPPKSAEPSIQLIEKTFNALGKGAIASIAGRYYAMDRDNRWERVEPVYNMLTLGKAECTAPSAASGLAAAYERGETDEFVKPTLITGHNDQPAFIQDGDAVLFMNFRPDRARELTRAFVDTEFNHFKRQATPRLSNFVTATEYAADINASCAYPPESLKNTFGEYLAGLNKTQLRIAETEKYAHVTFFFSGGQEALYPGEERVLIPSPNVATYDLQPEMSASEVTDKLVAAIESGRFDAIVCNYANGDMVGHTGVFDAAVKAVETVDACLGRVCTALNKVGGDCLITADHGNVEIMVDPKNGQALTSHTTERVPLVYVGSRNLQLQTEGTLADIAPTLLALMGLPQPPEMTGNNLVQFSG